MSGQKSDQASGSKGHNIPRGEALRTYLAHVTASVEKLERSLQSLPRVDDQGGSDCPFAEDLYAQKEALEAEVSSAAPTLRAYLAGLEQELSRCAQNLGKVRGAAGRIATAGVVEALDSAAKEAEDAVYRATTDRDAVELVLPRVEAALKVARTQTYPGKEPKRRMLPRVPGPDGQAPHGPGPSLGRELEDVFSLGPLSRGV